MCSFAKAQVYFSSPIDIGTTSSLQGYRPRIAMVNDTTPLVSWSKSGSLQGVYVSQWTYSAAYFSTPDQIFPAGSSFFTGVADGPELISKNDTVYITVWASTGPNEVIYLCRSFDAGNTFSDTVVVYSTVKRVEFPVIQFLNNGELGIAFMRSEPDESLPEILFTKSTDKGNSWSVPVNVSSLNPGQPCECCPLNMSVKDSIVSVSYRNNISNIRDFYTVLSYDNGASFTSGLAIDTSLFNTFTCPTSGVDGVVVGDTLYNCYSTKLGSFYQVKLSKTNLITGVNQNDFIGPLGISQNHPCIAACGDTLAMVYQQLGTAQDIFFTYKIGAGNWSVPVNITNAVSSQITPDITIKNGFFHIVYYDQGSDNRPKYIRGSLAPHYLSIPAEINSQALFAYPNPFQSTLHIAYEGPLFLYDCTGRLLANNVEQTLEVYISNLLPGTYFLRSGQNATQKIIKLH